MRRGVALALIVSLVGAATAWADETITAHTPNQFASSVTTIDQGEKVTFQNVDIVEHDVVATEAGDDAPLFRSGRVAPGSSGPVERTEYLTTGSYPFICTLHPGMEATLEVTSGGTPAESPEPGSGAMKLKVTSGKLVRIVKKRELKVRVTSAQGTVELKGRARSGKRKAVFKRRSVEFESAGTKTVALKLSRKGRNALRGRNKAKVTVTGTGDHGGGHTAEATVKRTLR